MHFQSRYAFEGRNLPRVRRRSGGAGCPGEAEGNRQADAPDRRGQRDTDLVQRHLHPAVRLDEVADQRADAAVDRRRREGPPPPSPRRCRRCRARRRRASRRRRRRRRRRSARRWRRRSTRSRVTLRALPRRPQPVSSTATLVARDLYELVVRPLITDRSRSSSAWTVPLRRSREVATAIRTRTPGPTGSGSAAPAGAAVLVDSARASAARARVRLIATSRGSLRPRAPRTCTAALTSGEMAREGRAWIGVSGYDYPHWGKGAFYPKDIPRRSWLPYALRYFNSIELNGTFYSLKNPDVFRRWVEDDAGGLRVRGEGQPLHHAQPEAAERRAGAGQLLRKRHPAPRPQDGAVPVAAARELRIRRRAHRRVSWTSCRWSSTEAEALARGTTIGSARSRGGSGGGACRTATRSRCAIRRISIPSSTTCCAGAAVAFVIAETAGKFGYAEEVTAPFVYVRLHGSQKLYASRYTAEELDTWAQRVHAWRHGRPARDVYVYFDNDHMAYAPHDAIGLRDRIEQVEGRAERLIGQERAGDRQAADHHDRGVVLPRPAAARSRWPPAKQVLEDVGRARLRPLAAPSPRSRVLAEELAVAGCAAPGCRRCTARSRSPGSSWREPRRKRASGSGPITVPPVASCRHVVPSRRAAAAGGRRSRRRGCRSPRARRRRRTRSGWTGCCGGSRG